MCGTPRCADSGGIEDKLIGAGIGRVTIFSPGDSVSFPVTPRRVVILFEETQESFV